MRAVAAFTVERWEDQDPYDVPSAGPPLGRTTVDKSFTGDIVGTSRAELLTCKESEAQAGYVASERLTVTIGDRAGSFVIQHGAIVNNGEFTLFGHVVPGSGTGDLAGITGQARYEHDANGARLTLDHELP